MRRHAHASIEAYTICAPESFDASQLVRRWPLDMRPLKSMAYIFCRLESEMWYFFTMFCRSTKLRGSNSPALCSTWKSSLSERPTLSTSSHSMNSLSSGVNPILLRRKRKDLSSVDTCMSETRLVIPFLKLGLVSVSNPTTSCPRR